MEIKLVINKTTRIQKPDNKSYTKTKKQPYTETSFQPIKKQGHASKSGKS